MESILINESVDQSTRRVILAGDRFTSRPYGMTWNKNQLYWTEFIHGNIIKYNLDTNTTSILLKNNPQLFEIKYYSANAQKDIKTQCGVGDCAQLCLLRPGASQVCACADGFVLEENQRDCVRLGQEQVAGCAEGEFQCASPSSSHAVATQPVCVSKDKAGGMITEYLTQRNQTFLRSRCSNTIH